MADSYQTCVVFLLGYPGVGKRTVGTHLAELLDGVLVDNQLINLPLLTLFKWDGKFFISDGDHPNLQAPPPSASAWPMSLATGSAAA